MYRAATFCVVFCLATLGFAQTSAVEPASSTASQQLVYVVDGSTLTTYNINSQTLQATEAGTTQMLQSVYPNIITSPNGHVVYYTAYQNTSQVGQKLYVYSTNTSGVPNGQPIQSISAQGFFSPFVDPTGKFLYVVHQGAVGSSYTTYTIRRYAIDPSTGKLSLPLTEASYKLDSYSSGLYCSLSLYGMNPAGTKLYDVVFCGYPHGGSEATYYERSVDPQTGALGPDQQIYSWDNASGAGHEFSFVKGFAFDFVISNFGSNANAVDIYWLKPSLKTPAISCTPSMLADCGSFATALAHPSAQYVFLSIPPSYVTDIAKVELNSKQIVGTSSTIPYEVRLFSPDGKIAYAAYDVNSAMNIQIYGFNASTAQVTAGGLISVPSNLDAWFAAERH